MDRETTQNLLDAMEGVAYLTDPDATVVAVGRDGWRTFAESNGAPSLADPASIVGRPLLDFVQGDEVKRAYERYLAALRAGPRRCLSFEFSCDAPQLARRMRMSISVVEEDKALAGFLFQSLMLEERSRPPVSLFDPEIISGALARRMGWPLLHLCSYCQRVNTSDDASGWMPAERYYQRGGTSEVRVSHGICPTCMKERVEPLLE